jgi:glycosyltransferase involved in cell wall biosynthesis
MGQYGWNVVQGLARTGRFRSITVLAGGKSWAQDRSANGHGAWDAAEVDRDHGTSSGGIIPSSEIITTRQAWSRDNLRAATRLVSAIRVERPDVAWFNMGFAVFGASRLANFLGLAVPMLTRHAGIPTVVTLHEIFESVYPRSLGMSNGHLTAWGAHAATRMVLQADLVCVTLARYVHALQAHYGARNLWHIPHGAFAPPQILPRPANAPPHDILIFATFAPFKGLPILVEAFEQVKRAYPDATLTVAGSDHPRFPGYLAEVHAQVNGRPGIHWLGPQSEAQLRELFACASVVALPYTATTGASSVLHRAAACGRPVVVSDLPDMRAVVEEENLRVEYAPPGEAAGLAAALLRLLADPDRGLSQTRHNFDIMHRMTLDHTCARYVELFERARQMRNKPADA